MFFLFSSTPLEQRRVHSYMFTSDAGSFCFRLAVLRMIRNAAVRIILVCSGMSQPQSGKLLCDFVANPLHTESHGILRQIRKRVLCACTHFTQTFQNGFAPFPGLHIDLVQGRGAAGSQRIKQIVNEEDAPLLAEIPDPTVQNIVNPQAGRLVFLCQRRPPWWYVSSSFTMRSSFTPGR